MTTLNTLVLIDSSVDDYQTLVKGISPEVTVIVLDHTRDGVIEITEALAEQTNVAAVHIVSHGSPGCLYLGNSQLSLDTLERYASQLQAWAEPLTHSPLLLYGCNVAAGDAGTEFIEKLHELTGAEIAASAKRTGSAVLGGNWELEVTTGKISAPLVFQSEVREAYRSVLANVNVSTATDVSDGDTSSITELINNPGEDGQISLREAIDATNNTNGADTITFVSPVFPNVITLTNGQLTITDNLTINGTGANSLFISGNDTSQVFRVDADAVVTIDGLTITNGISPGDGAGINNSGTLTLSNSTLIDNYGSHGGAIGNSGNLIVTNSTIIGNKSEHEGGGIFNDGGTVRVTNSTISGNTASDGGGIFNADGYVEVTNSTLSDNQAENVGGGDGNGGGIWNSGDLKLTNSILTSNQANDLVGHPDPNNPAPNDNNSNIFNGHGAGIFNDSNGNLQVVDTTLSNNTAFGNGGAIDNSGTISVSNNTINGNETTVGSGGGINNSGNLWLGNSTISSNQAELGGGGISNSTSGVVAVTSSTFSDNNGGSGGSGGIANNGTLAVSSSTLTDNVGTQGGGIGNFSDATLTVNHTTISGNTASSGGGIFNSDSSSLEVTNSILSGNQAADTGGIENDGTASIGNTIIAGNISFSSATDPDVFGNFTSDGNNLIGDATGSTGFINGVNGDQVGTSANPIIPPVVQLNGTSNADFLESTKGDDIIDGKAGNDTLDAESGNDTLLGGTGNDTLLGDSGDDLLRGGSGDDSLKGNSGNDDLRGGSGKDTLLGGSGEDILLGGSDRDTLTGGSGNDQFVYQAFSEKGDTITDFNRFEDNLVLTDLFQSLAYNGSDPIADHFIEFVQMGANTVVQIDTDGTGGSTGFNTLVTLNNVTATHLLVGDNVLV
jgi:hypothetical protein